MMEARFPKAGSKPNMGQRTQQKREFGHVLSGKTRTLQIERKANSVMIEAMLSIVDVASSLAAAVGECA